MPEDICGDHYVGPTGVEWVCVVPPHEPRIIKASNGQPDREIPNHYYVNRHAVEESHV